MVLMLKSEIKMEEIRFLYGKKEIDIAMWRYQKDTEMVKNYKRYEKLDK